MQPEGLSQEAVGRGCRNQEAGCQPEVRSTSGGTVSQGGHNRNVSFSPARVPGKKQWLRYSRGLYWAQERLHGSLRKRPKSSRRKGRPPRLRGQGPPLPGPQRGFDHPDGIEECKPGRAIPMMAGRRPWAANGGARRGRLGVDGNPREPRPPHHHQTTPTTARQAGGNEHRTGESEEDGDRVHALGATRTPHPPPVGQPRTADHAPYRPRAGEVDRTHP